MRTSIVLAAFLFVVAGAFFVYSMVITPRMDSGLLSQGYRPPIQDTPPSPETKPKPLERSNVPPAQGL